jgi:hypothetical protein
METKIVADEQMRGLGSDKHAHASVHSLRGQ